MRVSSRRRRTARKYRRWVRNNNPILRRLAEERAFIESFLAWCAQGFDTAQFMGYQ